MSNLVTTMKTRNRRFLASCESTFSGGIASAESRFWNIVDDIDMQCLSCRNSAISSD